VSIFVLLHLCGLRLVFIVIEECRFNVNLTRLLLRGLDIAFEITFYPKDIGLLYEVDR